MLSHDAYSMANYAGLPLQHYRFHLAPRTPLCMPAYNKGNVIRGGFGRTFRLSAARLPERGQVSAQAGLSAGRADRVSWKSINRCS